MQPLVRFIIIDLSAYDQMSWNDIDIESLITIITVNPICYSPQEFYGTFYNNEEAVRR